MLRKVDCVLGTGDFNVDVTTLDLVRSKQKHLHNGQAQTQEFKSQIAKA